MDAKALARIMLDLVQWARANSNEYHFAEAGERDDCAALLDKLTPFVVYMTHGYLHQPDDHGRDLANALELAAKAIQNEC